MEEKAKKMCGYIFAALVVVGLVLAIVGMCIGVISAMGNSITLFSEEWKALEAAADMAAAMGIDATAPSRMFTLISFVVLLVGAVLVLVDAILRNFVKKDIKVLRIVGVVVAFVGAILVLVAGIMLAGDFNEFQGLDVYSAGAGIYLGFIGGLVVAIAGGLPLLKVFND